MVLVGPRVVVLGSSGCIRKKSGCTRASVVVFGQKLLYSGKRGCIRAKLIYSGKSGCNREKVVVFG